MKTLFVIALVVLFASGLSYGQGRKQVSRIEQVDFANFTFPVGEDCAGLKRNIVTLRKGEFKDKEVRFQLKSKILGTFQIPVDSFPETSGGGRMVIP